MTVKKRLIGFNANEEMTSELKLRVESLGLTMSDYLKGLVRRDLDGPPAPAPAETKPSPQLSPESAPVRKAVHLSTKPTSNAVVPEKHLGRDLAVLIAWFLGLLEVLQYVHPTDVSLVAKNYTTDEDTTRPQALRKAVRQVLLDSWGQLSTWLKHLDELSDRYLPKA